MDHTGSTSHNNPSRPTLQDDWEDWEDDDNNENPTFTVTDQDGILIHLAGDDHQPASHPPTVPAAHSDSAPAPVPAPTATQRRISVQRLVRLKSKGRQKAQNAQAGIKLVTDMTKFRRAAQQSGDRSATRAKFSDAAALMALEGEPSSASVGSFSWLKKKPGVARAKSTKKPAQSPASALSPNDQPIVIGMAISPDAPSQTQTQTQAQAQLRTQPLTHPQTLNSTTHHSTVTQEPDAAQRHVPSAAANAAPSTPHQLRSVWSPDTEASDSPFTTPRAASSLYSPPRAANMYANKGEDIPQVPAIPAALKFRQTGALADADDDDDSGTPCTLFEEDGSPSVRRKSHHLRINTTTPKSAESRSHGWWDHITTPFSAKSHAFKTTPQTAQRDSASTEEWWHGANANEKTRDDSRSRTPGLTINVPAAAVPQPTVRSESSSDDSAASNRSQPPSEKEMLEQEHQTTSEQPPPYSPPQTTQQQVKYHVIMPPGSVSREPVLSPGPITPGLPGTMTSQGGIGMTDIPLSPGPQQMPAPAVLPDRAVGTYVPGDHFHSAAGTNFQTERQRRRHEKEDIAARRVGGFWRGRGCVPESGCLGRTTKTGREGRKRRRICLGVCCGVLALLILIVVLAVVLTRQAMQQPSPQPSVWLNLTDFPPMPTGTFAVTGPDNTRAISGCVQGTAQTAWTCSLPKEQHDSVLPYRPEQPTFLLQIQYDNNTRALWKGKGDSSQTTTTYDAGISPDPQPPSVEEIAFLGNATDGVVADNKEGELTPFFISMLTSGNQTAGPNMLARREANKKASISPGGSLADLLPDPAVEADGQTAAPAELFPHARQQPARLFDRGLPTEHYGFYTYFDKRTYLTDKDADLPVDREGGSLRADARFVAEFAETRFFVRMWTRRGNDTELLHDDITTAAAAGVTTSLPYPATLGEDMHGGNATRKVSFLYGMIDDDDDDEGAAGPRINRTEAKLINAPVDFGGTVVNPRASRDGSLGGIDGGTGGCACEWQNFKGVRQVGGGS